MPPIVAAVVTVAAGALGTAAATALGVGATIAGVVGTAVSAAVSLVAGGLTGGRRPSTRDPGVPVTIRQPVVPRRRVYGTKRVGGALVFPQLVNEKKNLLLIAAVSEGPVRGPLKIWFDDELVWERNEGAEPVNGSVAAYGTWQRGWDQWAYLEFHDGSQVAPSAYFVAASQGTSAAPRDLPVEGNVSQLLSPPASVSATTEGVFEDGTIDLGRDFENRAYDQIRVSWSAVAGAEEYLVLWQQNDGTVGRAYVPPTETSYVVGRTPLVTQGSLAPQVAARDVNGDWTDLVDTAGASADRELTWDANAVGVGVAYWAADLTWDKKRNRFPRGAPNITMELEGCRTIFDPRDDSTGYSANAALCLRHYLTDKENAQAESPGAPLIGAGAASEEIDDVSFSAHASLCDESVVTNDGGSEPRYETHGTVQAEEELAGTIADLSVNMASDLIFSGGVFKLVNGEVPPKVMDITDAMLAGPVAMTFERSRRDAWNTVLGEFQPPESEYVSVTYPAQKSAAGIAADGGVEIPRRLPLPFANSIDQAQRLALITVAEGRKKRFPQLALNLQGLQLEIGDHVGWARYGFNAGFRVDSVRLNSVQADGGQRSQPIVEVGLSEIDADAFAINQTDYILGTIVPRRRPPQVLVKPPSAVEYAIVQRQMNDGTQIFTSVVTWQASTTTDIRGYEVIYTWNDLQQVEFTTELRFEVDLAINNVFVRAVSLAGLESAAVPATLVGDWVYRDTTPPPDPTADDVANPLTTIDPGTVIVRVDPNPATDFKAFRVYAGPTDGQADDIDGQAGMANSEFVTAAFLFYLGRSPGASGLAYWTGQLNAGVTRDQVAASIGASFENASEIGPVGQSDTTEIIVEELQLGITYKIYVTAIDTTLNESGALDLGGIRPDGADGSGGPGGGSGVTIFEDNGVLVADEGSGGIYTTINFGDHIRAKDEGDGTVLVQGDPPVSDFAFFIPGEVPIDALLAVWNVTRGVETLVDLAGSVATVETNPSAPVAFSLRKNGTEFGTVTIDAAGAAAFESGGGAVTFVNGDKVTCVSPSLTSGLEGLAVTLSITVRPITAGTL